MSRDYVMRAETMTQGEIVKLCEKCSIGDCESCPANSIYIGDLELHPSRTAYEDRVCCLGRYLMHPVVLVPRWKTAKTSEDFERFRTEFEEWCDSDEPDCDDCPYGGLAKTIYPATTIDAANCYHRYLTEMIVKEG